MGHEREGADKEEERSRPGLQAVSHHAAKPGDLVPLDEEGGYGGDVVHGVHAKYCHPKKRFHHVENDDAAMQQFFSI
jgi:hypothetical protein